MAEPVEITQKLKDFFSSRNQEIAVLKYIGRGRNDEPVYMVSDIPMEILRDCYLGGPRYIFVDKDNIRNSRVLYLGEKDFFFTVDPDVKDNPFSYENIKAMKES